MTRHDENARVDEFHSEAGAVLGPRSASPLLLTRDELEALTSARGPKRMTAWLQARGWVFEPGARRGDVPKVDRSYYLARMSGQHPMHTRKRGDYTFMTRSK
jgi:hypothetical protein